jgi:hypothetical protein
MADTLETYHTVTPYLVVPDADAELKFLGGVRRQRTGVPAQRGNSVMHAEILIGDSLIMPGRRAIWPRPRVPLGNVDEPTKAPGGGRGLAKCARR